MHQLTRYFLFPDVLSSLMFQRTVVLYLTQMILDVVQYLSVSQLHFQAPLLIPEQSQPLNQANIAVSQTQPPELVRITLRYCYRPLDSLVVECWLRVLEVPSQGPCNTEDLIKIVSVVPLLSTQNLQGNTGSFSRIKIGQK